MSPSVLVPDAPHPSKAAATAASAGGPPGWPRRPRTRRRFWLALTVVLLGSVALYAPLWQGLLRLALVREAARHGSELTIQRIEGGLFDTFHLYGVHGRQEGLVPGSTEPRTDVRIARVDLTPDWSWPRRRQPKRSWLRSITLEGVSGHYDLATTPGLGGQTEVGGTPRSWLGRNAYRFVPESFFVHGGDLLVRRGRYHCRARDLRLSGNHGQPGFLIVRELEIGGPGFQNTFLNRHGETGWQGDRLTVANLELMPEVQASTLTLDGAHLGRRRLDWEATLAVLGGEVRAQGAVNLARTHLGLEVAGTLRQIPVQTVGRLLGLMGNAGGLIAQGNFSFRGDPEDPSAAEMWLAAQATDFRWGRRRWQSLEVQTVVLHRRVQVNKLELRQSRNQLSLRGEFPLPPGGVEANPATSRPWWEAGFSCTVDARLDDLQALSLLVGPRFPALEGRMSVNGTLEASPGHPGIEGYLNVEGSQLTVRGAPVDYLRSTWLFRGDEMQVADLQATHGGDYFTGKWTTRLVGDSKYAGDLRMAVKDRAVYAPALDGVLDLNKVGLGTEDPHAPLALDGSFHGPGPGGEAIFQTAGATAAPVNVPVPTVGDWWRDD